ncbi:MAG TPA: addiction module protein [Bryobacteraceae bacterium]|nr:addiction module protein [Bryobacteraceae bacterium]
MERHPAEVLRDALALPLEGRAALIDSLVDSLDQAVDEEAEEAWKREIFVRLQQIDNGAVQLIPWPSARLRLRDRLER